MVIVIILAILTVMFMVTVIVIALVMDTLVVCRQASDKKIKPSHPIMELHKAYGFEKNKG